MRVGDFRSLLPKYHALNNVVGIGSATGSTMFRDDYASYFSLVLMKS